MRIKWDVRCRSVLLVYVCGSRVSGVLGWRFGMSRFTIHGWVTNMRDVSCFRVLEVNGVELDLGKIALLAVI